jgi:hypothetical protein
MPLTTSANFRISWIRSETPPLDKPAAYKQQECGRLPLKGISCRKVCLLRFAPRFSRYALKLSERLSLEVTV